MGLRRHLQLGHGGRHLSQLDLDASAKPSLIDLNVMYACEECNNVFSTQENLAGHILSEHMKPSVVQSDFRSTRELQEAPEAVMHFEVSTDTAGIPVAASSNQLQLVGGSDGHSDLIRSLVKIEDPLTGMDKIVSILIPRDNNASVIGRNSGQLNIKREMDFSITENSVPATEDVVLNSDGRESSIVHTSQSVEYGPLPAADYDIAMGDEKVTSGGQVTYVIIDESNVSGFHAGSLVSGNTGALAETECGLKLN